MQFVQLGAIGSRNAVMLQINTGGLVRQQRLDSFRLYAIFLIICAHVHFFGGIDHTPWLTKIANYLITVGFRYTIPFFFILAGYFTGGKIIREPSKAISIAFAYTLRISIILFFWCFIYIVEQPQAFLYLLQKNPVQLFFEGPSVHLWFLISLILTVWLFVLWPFRRNYKSFLWLGIVLYVIGLLAGSYNVTPLGINLDFNTRNAVFFSALFFAIGVAFHEKLPRLSWKVAVAISIGGLTIYCLEALYLRLVWGLYIPIHDYLLGSVPFGIGISLLALTQPDTALDKVIGPYGRYTLGIYAMHLLFLDLFKPLGSWVNPYVWQVIYPILIFGFSLITSVILAKTPLRKVIL